MNITHLGTWIIIINSNTYRIYDYSKKHHSLAFLEEKFHEENKLRDTELTADKPGRYHAGATVHGSYTQETDPRDIKIDNFAREAARVLDHGRTVNAYEHLIVIAPAHMNGLLRQHLNKHVKALVAHTVEKDVFHLNERELVDFLHEHTQYPDK